MDVVWDGYDIVRSLSDNRNKVMSDKIEKEFCLNHNQIEQYLEISPPFLMIDYVEEIIPGKNARAIKYLKEDDWFFKCHMQREQAMPGSLQIEAMLQTLVLTIYTMDGHKGNFHLFQI